MQENAESIATNFRRMRFMNVRMFVKCPTPLYPVTKSLP